MATPKFHTLTVKDITRETADTVSISFDVPPELAEAYNYIPGQYLTLKTDIDNSSIRRSYSICSAPSEKELRVAVKQVENGKFSTFANTVLKIGDSLDVMTPTGNFHSDINSDQVKKYVAFAAGSGITPILSIIRHVLETEQESHFTLFYGNKSLQSIIFREQLEALKNEYMDRFTLFHILSREVMDVDLFSGRIDQDKCRAYAKILFQPETIDEYFICGPEAMIHTVREVLTELKIDQKKVHFELFTSPDGSLKEAKKVVPEDELKEGTYSLVTIQLDGKSFDFKLAYEGENILDAAMRQGADLPYSCKGGVCCTCRAKLQTGEVKMEVNYALEPEEVEQGFILTCQAHPLSEKIFVDYDEQ